MKYADKEITTTGEVPERQRSYAHRRGKDEVATEGGGKNGHRG